MAEGEFWTLPQQAAAPNQAAFPGKEPKASPVSGMLSQALLTLISLVLIPLPVEKEFSSDKDNFVCSPAMKHSPNSPST